MSDPHEFNIVPLKSEPSIYFEKRKYGYLVRYFTPVYVSKPDPFMTIEDYRGRSYAPSILNYKEGKIDHIKLFVKGMTTFIEKVLEIHKLSKAILVPVPSSKAKTDPLYNNLPKGKKSARNRDDRNEIFLKQICELNSNLEYSDNIMRLISKPEKVTLNIEATKLQLNLIDPDSLKNKCVILIDDVVTTGTTFAACRELIEEITKPILIITLAIGQTRPHSEFKKTRHSASSNSNF